LKRECSSQTEFSLYVGLDWGTEFHRACVLSASGKAVKECRIDHSGDAISEFLRSVIVIAGGQADRIAVAIEVPRGPVVEAFLESGCAVFSINPKQLDRFRDRYTVAGAKDDSRDAYVAADSLRTDQHCFRRVRVHHPDVVRLRELSRTEESVSGDFRRTANQLYQLLLRYYPQLLRLKLTPDEPWIWALLELAPVPQRGAKLTVARLKQLLSRHRIHRWTAEELRQVLAAPALPLSAGSADAISEHALLLLPQLRLLHHQRQEIRDRLEALLNQMTAVGREHPESREHRDVGLMLSLPGLGCLIAANLFTEGADPVAQRDYAALRAQSGIAPVTRQSGKSKQVIMRRGCSQRLRNAMYHWARCSVQHDSLSKSHYKRLRGAGHGHGRALRGVADRLLVILMAMLKNGEPYDANRRQVHADRKAQPHAA
jgi:transposase